jgi:cytochrome c peroxidase
VTVLFAAPRDVAESPKLPPPAVDSDFATFSDVQVELGKFLFYDKILSGNENISCATCHHALADTGDGLSLPVGEGGRGLGVIRDTGELNDTPVVERVPRNAPHLFNLGAHEFTVMFHDGRVEADPDQPGGFRSPAGIDLPDGLVSALAAQALFPVTSNTEMAGQEGENEVANAAAAGDLVEVWDLLAQRIAGYPEYVFLFGVAFDDVQGPEDITFVHAANAIAAYEATAWRADNSPFDRYLRGDKQAMSLSARKGMQVFYRAANCGSCHSGTFLTDQQFHCIGMPQVGPGKGDGFDGHEDFGRERVTGDPADRYRFRTPTLRNVALTGPWGHAGAYGSLEAVVRHKLDVMTALASYDPSQVELPSRPDLDAQDYLVINDVLRMKEIGAASELPVVDLSEVQIRHLIDFLNALTDPSSIDLRADCPDRVPSGRPLTE